MATRTEIAKEQTIALRCAVEWLPLRAAAAKDGSQSSAPKNRPFRMVAYTGGVANIDWWGPVVFDIATMDLTAGGERIPALRDHDASKILGFTEKREKTTEGVVCEGELFEGMEHADEVIQAAERGFPWQASVWLTRGSIERVDPGVEMDVNGRKLSGPFTLHRHTKLKETSFCPLGGDMEASAELAASHGGSPMAGSNATTPTATPAATPVQAGAPVPVPAPVPAPITAAASREEFSALLTERPAQKGLIAELFAAGKSVGEIRAAAAAKDNELLAAKDAEILQLRAQIAQPGIGFDGAAREAGDPQASAGSAGASDGDDLKASAEKVWKSKPELRAEFGNEFRWYLAECRRSGKAE